MPPETLSPTPLSRLVLPPRYALFLDFDGTLVDIAARPEDARPPAELPALLRRLHERLEGALALISGRPIAAFDAMFGQPPLPSAGQHGMERRRADGTVERRPVDSKALTGMTRLLEAFAAEWPGVLLEPKGMTVALHYRLAPDAEGPARRAVATAIAPYGDRFRVYDGKKVLEIKPAGANKGTAIEAFMAEPAFAGRTPIFAGDDTTDEDGFAVVNRLGGISLLVGERRPTLAAWRTPDVASLRAWLQSLDAEATA